MDYTDKRNLTNNKNPSLQQESSNVILGDQAALMEIVNVIFYIFNTSTFI